MEPQKAPKPLKTRRIQSRYKVSKRQIDQQTSKRQKNDQQTSKRQKNDQQKSKELL